MMVGFDGKWMTVPDAFRFFWKVYLAWSSIPLFPYSYSFFNLSIKNHLNDFA